jgi:5,10-methylenetetrahydromethanopterin reductase
METWTLLPCLPKVAAREAAVAEAEGWTGILLADSQNLAAELVVEMAMCVSATERLLIGPGVTNPVTRHPAVLAGAMATLQAESGGRIVVELGRGDSSLAHLGFAPVKVGPFANYLRALRSYLAGDEVAFDPAFVTANLTAVSSLELGEEPAGSRLRWLRPGQPRVPVGVAATGPKVIELAAVHSDGVSLSVGADPERVGAAVDLARKARARAGMDTEAMRIAAFVNVAVHDDLETAAAITSGKLASFSRFSVMHGTVTGGATNADKATLEQLQRSYDMNKHGQDQAAHAQLPLEFAERNAVIGSAGQCLEKLAVLRKLGVNRLIFTEDFSRAGESGRAHENLVRDVLPEVAAWA